MFMADFAFLPTLAKHQKNIEGNHIINYGSYVYFNLAYKNLYII